MQEIAPALLDRSVTGINLMPGSLRDQLAEDPSLLVFLRHFGCIFCRETLADLRELTEKRDDFPRVLFFFQGNVTEGKAFLRRYWPTARAIADPELSFYDGFGVGRASLAQALGPAVWKAARRAAAKGHESAERSGDTWRMPGVFLVSGARVIWSYEPRHAGDHPEFARIVEHLSVA